jgi:hypothetical protein
LPRPSLPVSSDPVSRPGANPCSRAVWSAKLQRSQMALMRRGAPAPPPLRLGALLVLCSLSGLAVPVGSGSAAGELSAAAPLLPLLPPPVALADSHAAARRPEGQDPRAADAEDGRGRAARRREGCELHGGGCGHVRVRLLPGHGRGQNMLHREPQGFRPHLGRRACASSTRTWRHFRRAAT